MTVVAQPFIIGRRCPQASTKELCCPPRQRDKAAEAYDQSAEMFADWPGFGCVHSRKRNNGPG